MKQSSYKKLMDETTPASKRYMLLFKFTVDSSTESEVRQFYQNNYSMVYKIFLDSLQQLDHNAKNSKGKTKATIPMQDIEHLCVLLKNLFTHVRNIVESKWQMRSITHNLEVLLVSENIQPVKKIGYDLLLHFIDILQDKCDLKLLNLIMKVIDVTTLVPPEVNVRIPQFDVRILSDDEKISLPTKPDPNTPTSEEETLQLLQMLFNFINKDDQFDFWWGIFKARLAPIFYPKECQELDLLTSVDDMGFRDLCPYKVHIMVIAMLLDSLQNSKRSDVLYRSDIDIFLMLLIFRQSFHSLPVTEYEHLNNMLKMYRAWICKDSLHFKWPKAMEDNKSTYMRIFIDHLSQVFFIEPQKGAVDQLLDLAFQVLEMFKFISNNFDKTDTETRNDLLLTYLSIVDHIFKSLNSSDPAKKEFATTLEKSLAMNLFLIWLRAKPDSHADKLWSEFSKTVQRNFESSHLLSNWRITTLNVTKTMIGVLWKLDAIYLGDHMKYESENYELKRKDKDKAKSAKPTRNAYLESTEELLSKLDEEMVLHLWHRMIEVYGNDNLTRNGSLHAAKISVLGEVIDEFVRISQIQIAVPKGSSQPQVFAHSPEANTLFKLFGTWFFEACLRTDSEFSQGRATAYRSLSRIICQKSSQPIAREYLAEYYKMIQLALIPPPNQSQNDRVIEAIITHSYKLFSLAHEGVTLLIPAYIKTVQSLLSKDSSSKPLRLNCLNLTISLICYCFHYPRIIITPIPVNREDPNSCQAPADFCTSESLRAKMRTIFVDSLNEANHDECNILCVWGLFVMAYKELTSESLNAAAVQQCIEAILETILHKSDTVALAVVDAVVAFAHLDLLSKLPNDLDKLMIQRICSALIYQLREDQQAKSVGTGREDLIVSLYYCLADVVINSDAPRLLDDPALNGILFDAISLGIIGDAHTKYDFEPDQSAQKSDSVKVRKTLRIGGSKKTQGQASSSTGSNTRPAVAEAAQGLLMHLLNTVNHFPTANGPSQVSSDFDEYKNMNLDDISGAPASQPDPSAVGRGSPWQHFVFNESSLVTYRETRLSETETAAQIIIRDMTGKYCWQSRLIYHSERTVPLQAIASSPSNDDVSIEKGRDSVSVDEIDGSENGDAAPMEEEVSDNADIAESEPVDKVDYPHFDPSINFDKTDMLELLGQYVDKTYTDLAGFITKTISLEAQNDKSHEQMDADIRKQSLSEKTYLDSCPQRPSQHVTPPLPFNALQVAKQDPGAAQEVVQFFRAYRMFASNMGFLSDENRPTFARLDANPRLYRELRQLDKLSERETIKIGVIFVRNQQESQRAILRNSDADPKDAPSGLYEDFVSGLGWSVNLATHPGFLGGLDTQGSTGKTAPYWANNSMEVVFHVITRMPTKENDEQQIHKKRHVGNDIVHVVWSEHDRDYRPCTIISNFNFVHIVIYPLPNDLFRIQIFTKEEAGLPMIGPLVDAMIVDRKALAPLVRQTAINANRAVRYNQDGYKRPYPTRREIIDEIIERFKIDKIANEDWLAPIFHIDVSEKQLSAAKIQQQLQQQQKSAPSATTSETTSGDEPQPESVSATPQ